MGSHSVRTPVGVTGDAAGRELIIRGGLGSGTGAVLAILAGAIGIGLLFAFVSPRPEAIPPAAPALLAATGAALACWAGLQILSRERLIVGEDEVVHERLVVGFRWRRRSLARTAPIDLRIQPRGAGRGVIVAAEGQTLHVGRALDSKGIEWLHTWLARCLTAAGRGAARRG